MDENYVKVGTVARLTLFPLKSAKGVDLQDALCTGTGLKTKNGDFSDRHWIVVNTSTNRFVTGRQEGKLTTIKTSLNGDYLHLDATGMQTLRLPKNMSLQSNKIMNVIVWGEDIEGVDCGNKAADWINDFLGNTNYRLLFCAPGLKYRELVTSKDKWLQNAKPTDQVAYQDASPFLMISEASLEDVNSHLPENISRVEMKQFRPNIVVSSCGPFDEDNWKNIRIGDLKFTNIKPCDRCILTTVDPETGLRNSEMEPLKTLRSYRLLVPEFGEAPCFGVNLIVEQEGVIKVGDPILMKKE